MSWVALLLTFSLVNNVVLGRLLGICPCVSAPRGMRAAVGIGVSVSAIMSVSALTAWALAHLVLDPLGLGFLLLPAFLLSLAGLTFFLDAMARLLFPLVVRAVGFSLPAVAVNCATLGVALIVAYGPYGPLEGLLAGLASGLGFLLVLALLTAIRERLDTEQAPAALRGLPLHLISAALLAWAFMAFDRGFLARLLGR
jgi:electron transport complex protein RnfA